MAGHGGISNLKWRYKKIEGWRRQNGENNTLEFIEIVGIFKENT